EAIRQTALETLTVGRQLADALGVELIAVLLGPPGLATETGTLGTHGADRVLTGFSDALAEYVPEGYAELVAKAARDSGAKAVVFSAGAQGKDLAPRVAARLKVGLASDVTEVGVEDGRVVAVRPAYAGKVFMRVSFKSEPAVFSVRPRAYKAAESPREAQVDQLAVDADPAARTKVQSVAEAAEERPDVAEAEIIVAGGRGLGGPENWKLIEELANVL
ncbi:MAG: electron transfer flavoprotein subunit alpha/FixB family protein, partial [Gemmatimonadetes bacterium]|nr:electron transfer flavoprotein subunit alpha/FixB family protein [Gemmatimonadota bacterium]NIR99774.1 electron transfer flavoprotein subunit alpha/FixB family protein [Gemmatimonadota bacterium]NIT65360.1 electron transfer flavoprotein subunit alpha/FixB family protein [Gemmatimonadota bacterium]NIU52805.1 electron transfer flavoprotein subunit alpha/FixB family protein [Gemmatimonadota bacterium]NIV22101.1 electron transfer flavoprotein subunit alpha/FixB family protein [Gemmatimonadota ba